VETQLEERLVNAPYLFVYQSGGIGKSGWY
jgi:hypothetical protein